MLATIVLEMRATSFLVLRALFALTVGGFSRFGICGEGELAGGVHTLVWRSVQVYHELHELEEEDKGREEVQEIERESQVEENHSHGHDYGDDMKRLKHLEPQCVCG